MTWPAGQKNGPKWTQQLAGEPLLQSGVLVPTLTSATCDVPWYQGGFRSCLWEFVFTLTVAGQVHCGVTPLDSDTNSLIGGQDLVPATSFPPVGSGCGGWILTFDDGPLPGNIGLLQVTPQGSLSLPLNPCWNKAAFLRFTIDNLGAGDLTVGSNRILLST